MNQTQSLALAAEERRGFLQRLMNPAVDRVIAVIAILPMLWAAYYRYEHYGLNLPVFYYFMNPSCSC